MMQEKEIHSLVESYIRAYNKFEIDTMVSLFSSDCVFESVSNSGNSMKCVGPDKLRETALHGASFFSQRQQSIVHWIFGQDKAVVELQYNAVLAKDLPGGLKAGSEMKLQGVSVFEFADGKIKRLADYS